jgi:hypothetical protein
MKIQTFLPPPSGYSAHPEDGGSKVLRNGGIQPHDYTASQLGRSRAYEPFISAVERFEICTVMKIQTLLPLTTSLHGVTIQKIATGLTLASTVRPYFTGRWCCLSSPNMSTFF